MFLASLYHCPAGPLQDIFAKVDPARLASQSECQVLFAWMSRLIFHQMSASVCQFVCQPGCLFFGPIRCRVG